VHGAAVAMVIFLVKQIKLAGDALGFPFRVGCVEHL